MMSGDPDRIDDSFRCMAEAVRRVNEVIGIACQPNCYSATYQAPCPATENAPCPATENAPYPTTSHSEPYPSTSNNASYPTPSDNATYSTTSHSAPYPSTSNNASYPTPSDNAPYPTTSYNPRPSATSPHSRSSIPNPDATYLHPHSYSTSIQPSLIPSVHSSNSVTKLKPTYSPSSLQPSSSRYFVTSSPAHNLTPPPSPSLSQRPSAASYLQRPSSATFLQPPSSASYLQPPSSGGSLQRPYSACYLQRPSVSFLQRPTSASHLQPPSSGSSSQRPSSPSRLQPSPSGRSSQLPSSSSRFQPSSSGSSSQLPSSPSRLQPSSASYLKGSPSVSYLKPSSSSNYLQPSSSASYLQSYSSASNSYNQPTSAGCLLVVPSVDCPYYSSSSTYQNFPPTTTSHTPCYSYNPSSTTSLPIFKSPARPSHQPPHQITYCFQNQPTYFRSSHPPTSSSPKLRRLDHSTSYRKTSDPPSHDCLPHCPRSVSTSSRRVHFDLCPNAQDLPSSYSHSHRPPSNSFSCQRLQSASCPNTSRPPPSYSHSSCPPSSTSSCWRDHSTSCPTTHLSSDYSSAAFEDSCRLTPSVIPEVEEEPRASRSCLSCGVRRAARAAYVGRDDAQRSGLRLLRAAQEGHLRTVCRLLADGADANFTYATKWTALHRAVRMGHVDVVLVLLGSGADVNARTDYDFTALHVAAASNPSDRIASLLLAAGADVSARSRRGRTPLHYAAEYSNGPVTLLLLDGGACLAAVDDEGTTPFDLAREECVRRLLRPTCKGRLDKLEASKELREAMENECQATGKRLREMFGRIADTMVHLESAVGSMEHKISLANAALLGSLHEQSGRLHSLEQRMQYLETRVVTDPLPPAPPSDAVSSSPTLGDQLSAPLDRSLSRSVFSDATWQTGQTLNTNTPSTYVPGNIHSIEDSLSLSGGSTVRQQEGMKSLGGTSNIGVSSSHLTYVDFDSPAIQNYFLRSPVENGSSNQSKALSDTANMHDLLTQSENGVLMALSTNGSGYKSSYKTEDVSKLATRTSHGSRDSVLFTPPPNTSSFYPNIISCYPIATSKQTNPSSGTSYYIPVSHATAEVNTPTSINPFIASEPVSGPIPSNGSDNINLSPSNASPYGPLVNRGNNTETNTFYTGFSTTPTQTQGPSFEQRAGDANTASSEKPKLIPKVLINASTSVSLLPSTLVSLNDAPTKVGTDPIGPERRAALGKQLLKAAEEGKTRDVVSLLNRGVDVDFTYGSKWTPLHCAARNGHAGVVSELLKRGADVRSKASFGFTALHLAAVNDSVGKCVWLLVGAGSDLCCRNAAGRTALHLAAECANLAAVQALVAAGASKGAKDAWGKTPLDLATDCVRKFLI